MRIVLNVALAAVIAGFAAGCFLIGPHIHFVLPDGYVGAFRLVLDEIGGADVEEEGGAYTYRIPKSGELKVKSFQPFMRWHQITASYEGGLEIPSEHSEVGADVIALRSGSGSGTREVDGKNVGPIILNYVIGTEEHVRSINTQMLDTTSTPKP